MLTEKELGARRQRCDGAAAAGAGRLDGDDVSGAIRRLRGTEMTGYSSQPISQQAAKELLALPLGGKVF